MNLLFISSHICGWSGFSAQLWYVSSQNLAWFLKPRGMERSVISRIILAASTEYKGRLKSLYFTLDHVTPKVRRTVLCSAASCLFSLRLFCVALNAHSSTFHRPPSFDVLLSEFSTIATRLTKLLSSMKISLLDLVMAFLVNSDASLITSIPCSSTTSRDLRIMGRALLLRASHSFSAHIIQTTHKSANITRETMIEMFSLKLNSLVKLTFLLANLPNLLSCCESSAVRWTCSRSREFTAA